MDWATTKVKNKNFFQLFCSFDGNYLDKAETNIINDDDWGISGLFVFFFAFPTYKHNSLITTNKQTKCSNEIHFIRKSLFGKLFPFPGTNNKYSTCLYNVVVRSWYYILQVHYIRFFQYFSRMFIDL